MRACVPSQVVVRVHGRHQGRAAAFTLLEVMLAIVLGSLVALAALALFSTVERSDKRSRIQLDRNMEMATAHTAIARAFHLLLMSSEAPPNERDIEDFLKQDDERNSTESAEREDEDASSTRIALQPDTNGAVTMTIGSEGRQRRARSQTFRVTLRASPILSGGEKSEDQEWREKLDREHYLLKASERLNRRVGGGSSVSKSSKSASGDSARGGSGGGGALGDALALVDKASGGKSGEDRSGRSRSGRGKAGSSARGSSSSDSTGRNLALHPKRGSDNATDERTASERLDDEEEERPRALGIRGVFELLPDGAGGDYSDGTGLRQVAEESDQPTYSLWWRELPPLEIDEGDDVSVVDGGSSDNSSAALSESRSRDDGKSAGGKSDSKSKSKHKSSGSSSRSGRSDAPSGDRIDRQVEQLASSGEGSGKRVRLLSGLTTCHWTALRGRKERDKITAKFDRHLPAFVELEIVTAAGRRENWLFDLAWSVGPEPGSVLPDAADPLNGTPTLAETGQNGGGVDEKGNPIPAPRTDRSQDDPRQPRDPMPPTPPRFVPDKDFPNEGGRDNPIRGRGKGGTGFTPKGSPTKGPAGEKPGR